MKILDVVDKYPKTEDIFRGLESVTNDCVLCKHLFDDFDEFLKEYDIDREIFSEVMDKKE